MFLYDNEITFGLFIININAMKSIFTILIAQFLILGLSAQTFQNRQNSERGILEYPENIRIPSQKPNLITHSNGKDYCIPLGVNCTEGDGFTDFELNEISNLASGCSDDGYGDFTSMETTLMQGSTYDVTFASGYGTQQVCLWIDFDEDTEFEAEELLLTDFAIPSAGTLLTTQIVIPNGVSSGTKRLRIRANYNASAQDPCEVWTYGETEDYSAIIGDPMDADVGVLSINMEEGYGPGNIIPKVTVKNYGALQQSFNVSIEIIGTYLAMETVYDLPAGQEAEVEFAPWESTLGEYNIEACTDLDGDENPLNDCLESNIIISGADVGVVLISNSSELMVGDHIPKVKVENFAYDSQTFPVTFTVGDYSDTQTVTDLAPMESVFVEFTSWTAEAGIYTAEACTELPGDENPDNDCATKQLFVGEGFPDFRAHETNCLTGLSLPFKDISTIQVTAWDWEFEGGTPGTSTESNPTITYNTPGTYDVIFTVSGPNGQETITKENYIMVADEITAEWTNVLSNGKWISDIHFIDENVGFFCGEDGMVFKTEDSGLTWQQNSATGSGPWAYNIRFIDDLEGYISFYKAKLMKTDDGGETWEWITPDVPTGCRLFGLDVWDSEHLLIAGQKTTESLLDAYTTQTGPGGFTAYQTPGGSQYNALNYLSEDTIIMQHFMDITFSYDGGQTFESIDNQLLFGYFKNCGYNTMDFPTNKIGFMGGTDYNQDGIGIIAKTTDAGQSWVELRDGFDECRGTHFLDKDIGFMVGHNGFIYKTIDGGENWYGTHLPTVDIESVFLVNENLIFIASRGGDVYRSANGFLQQPHQFDLFLNSCDLPEIVNLDNAPFTLSTIVSNNGLETIGSFNLNYQVDNGEVSTTEFSGLNPELINSVNMEAIHSDGWNPTLAGTYNVKIWVDHPNGEEDQFTANDTIIINVSVVGEQLHNRIAIIEEATGTWCQYCPSGQLEVAYTLETLNQEETRVLAIALHGGDQFETNGGDEVLTAFGGGAYPAGWVDRYQFFGEPSVGLPGGTWTERTSERLAADSPMDVDLEVLYHPYSSSIAVNITANVITGVTGNLRFNCYIIEDSLIAPQANAYNNIPGHPYYGWGNPIPEFVHNHVLRNIIGETWGTQGEFPTTVTSGDSYTHQFDFVIPDDYVDENLQVVGFISYWDDDLNARSIINANHKSFLEFTPVGEHENRIVPGKISASPNPFNSTVKLTLKNFKYGMLEVQIMDILGVVHKTENINWTGSQVEISTEKLKPGVYLMNIKINDTLMNLKLLKE